MSDIRFRCPSCRKKLAVGSEGAGTLIICPRCRDRITIPNRSASEAELATPGKARGAETTTQIHVGEDHPKEVLAELVAEVGSLRKEVAAGETLRERYEALQVETQRSAEEASIARARAEEAAKQRKALEGILRQRESDLIRLREALEESGEGASSRETTLEETRRELASLKESLAAAEGARQQIERARDEAVAARQRAEEARHEALRSADSERRTEAAAAAELRKDLEVRLGRSDQELEHLRHELKLAKASVFAAEEEARELQQTLDREREVLRDLQRDLKAREDALRAAGIGPFAPERPPTSGKTPEILLGWFCLIAALTIQVLSPRAYLLYGPLLAGAFLFGGLAWAHRRTPLVTGLLALAMVSPVALMLAMAETGFEGILPGLELGKRKPAEPSNGTGGAGSSPSAPDLEAGAIPVGGTVTVDQVRVTFDAVRSDRITIRDVLGKETRTDQAYLLVDLTLENTDSNQTIFLKNAWESTECRDDTGGVTRIVPQQREGLDRILGTLGSAELESGIPRQERLVFQRPPEEAKTFMIRSDPGFYEETLQGDYQPVSDEFLILTFDRGAVEEVPPESP